MDEVERMLSTQRLMDASLQMTSIIDASKAPAITQPWSSSLVVLLCIGVLVFALLLASLATLLLMRTTVPPHYVIRLFGVTSIITFSAFLLVVGYSNEQLTPIIGLFGAIAGYLLGKEISPTVTAPANEPVK